jgi:hypothetical protein
MDILQNREAAIRVLLEQGLVTLLRLDGDRIALDVVTDDDALTAHTLEVWSFREVLKHLRHEPPAADELESAIATIEDMLMPVMHRLPGHRCLATVGREWYDVVKAADRYGGHGGRLEIAMVELLFNRLVDAAYGVPPEKLGVPAGRDFAAHVLLLRELMQHGGYESVEILC